MVAMQQNACLRKDLQLRADCYLGKALAEIVLSHQRPVQILLSPTAAASRGVGGP
jgi:hypothetical protein